MKKLQLNGFHLKMIAVCAMFIDHFAYIILYQMIYQPMSFWANWDADIIYIVYNIMRRIGRMAFPIYIFLLIEGFHYTRSRVKYARNLAIFAIISEIPYDIAFSHMIVDWAYCNVFFTLLIGFLVIWIAEELYDHRFTDKAWLATILSCVVAIVGAVLAEWIVSDYDAAGIIAIFVCYLFYRKEHTLLGMLAAIIVLTISYRIEIYALFVLIPLYFYDGTRGKQNKYFFYVFYPGHLIVLCLLAVLMGLPLLN